MRHDNVIFGFGIWFFL